MEYKQDNIQVLNTVGRLVNCGVVDPTDEAIAEAMKNTCTPKANIKRAIKFRQLGFLKNLKELHTEIKLRDRKC